MVLQLDMIGDLGGLWGSRVSKQDICAARWLKSLLTSPKGRQLKFLRFTDCLGASDKGPDFLSTGLARQHWNYIDQINSFAKKFAELTLKRMSFECLILRFWYGDVYRYIWLKL